MEPLSLYIYYAQKTSKYNKPLSLLQSFSVLIKKNLPIHKCAMKISQEAKCKQKTGYKPLQLIKISHPTQTSDEFTKNGEHKNQLHQTHL